MKDDARMAIQSMVLAPYIQKATALVGCRRRVGGNQFRHAMATFAILVDYGYTDPVLLKASIIHDLFEDVPDTDRRSITDLDEDGPRVVALVDEVTRRANEEKGNFLARVRDRGSRNARILKIADRISNLTDLHETVFDPEHVERYVAQTGNYVLPMANAVAPTMAIEVADLMRRRTVSAGPELAAAG